jgi:hypothetical protein
MVLRNPGIYNDVNIQKNVIEHLLRSLGSDVWKAMDKDRSVNLRPHLLHAKQQYLSECGYHDDKTLVQPLYQVWRGSRSHSESAKEETVPALRQ